MRVGIRGLFEILDKLLSGFVEMGERAPRPGDMEVDEESSESSDHPGNEPKKKEGKTAPGGHGIPCPKAKNGVGKIGKR